MQAAVGELGARLAAGAEAAGEAARLREAIRWSRLLDDAHAEHARRGRTALEQVEADRRAAVEAEEVRGLRAQLLREYPELALYAQEQT
ncbi:hypothetical protein ACWCQL_36755 [Streptomyces sp. NPDC002073]